MGAGVLEALPQEAVRSNGEQTPYNDADKFFKRYFHISEEVSIPEGVSIHIRTLVDEGYSHTHHINKMPNNSLVWLFLRKGYPDKQIVFNNLNPDQARIEIMD